jgi:hypothetical protein
MLYDYQTYMQHYYEHYHGALRMSSEPPDPNEEVVTKFRTHNIADEIMESWQLSVALSGLMAYCNEDEKKILKKIRRLVVQEFFESLNESSKSKWSQIKNSLNEDLEFWKKAQEKREEEQKEKMAKETKEEEEEKPKRKKKGEGDKEDGQ